MKIVVGSHEMVFIEVTCEPKDHCTTTIACASRVVSADMFRKESTHHTGTCCMSCSATRASRCTACICGSARCDRRLGGCGGRMTRTCRCLRTRPISHVPIRLRAPPLRHSATSTATAIIASHESMFRSYHRQCGTGCSIAGTASSHEEQGPSAHQCIDDFLHAVCVPPRFVAADSSGQRRDADRLQLSGWLVVPPKRLLRNLQLVVL
jgi:hypothetical protein